MEQHFIWQVGETYLVVLYHVLLILTFPVLSLEDMMDSLTAPSVLNHRFLKLIPVKIE